jgi:YegS/Rv2252/BmrU family lipid kinase
VDLAHRAGADLAEPLDIVVTERRGHASEAARAALAGGASLVVAWGGDGTVNEVASMLASTDVHLGIVPAGSGNGLARALKLPRDPAQALAVALRGGGRRIDMGEMGGRLFANVAGVGFDACVAAQFDDPRNVVRGFPAYARIVLRTFATYSPLPYTIVLRPAAAPLRSRALLVTFANGPQYGNGVTIAPGASIDDGLLTMVIVEERSRLATLVQLPRLFNGTIGQSPDCRLQDITEAQISSDTAMAFHVDGEPAAGGTSVEVRVRPKVLWVREGRV